MELWLDTIEIDVIREAEAMGILTGVTTNPSILCRSDVSPEKKIKQLLENQSGWLAVQIVAENAQDMIEQARALSQLSERIIVKIPVTIAGLKAISSLAKNEIPTMATAIFEPRQLLLAAIAGARYAAPYMSRIEEMTQQSCEILAGMMKMNFQQSYSLKVIAAAIKSAEEVTTYAKLGVQAITLPVPVFEAFISNHPRTESSLLSFEKDWLAGAHTSESEIFTKSPA